MDKPEQPDQPLYRYRFEDAEFDEARAELRVAGAPVDLEQRPLQVLALLLRRVDEVVPRTDLFDTVWGGRPTVDNVLANAIAKLRKALGATASKRIVNVPRIGYRLQGPVERIVAGRKALSSFALREGQAVPGREHFILRECLDPAAGGSVWRVRHEKTGEPRIYKFAADGEQLAALKREVTIQRVLRESLGERDDLVRLVDWNFEVSPCWLQYADAGIDLAGWGQGDALLAASREQRIGWFLQIADAVAAAHGAGVLHKDLKPSNVLVAPRGDDWQLRVADFGSGRLLEPGKLDALGITRLGLTVTGAVPENSGVTLLYLAPEVLAGAAPSVQSDVYALGLILLQMLVGDFHRTLAPGWEQDIDDDLLREDIAAATHGDPAKRLASADALVQRLRNRESRAIERQHLRDSDARALAAERALERARARRPWLAAAIALLAAGLVVSLWQVRRVRAARTDAQHQAAIANAANRFLIDDLLGAGMGDSSPAWYERNPSLREILDASAAKLDVRFAAEPMMRASLHQTLGRAYRSTGAWDKAAVQLQAALDELQATLGGSDERSLLAQYELAPVLAHLSRFKDADALLSHADAAAGPRRNMVSEIALRAHLAHGQVAFQRMQVKPALAEYQAAEPLQRLLHPDDAAMSAHILLAIAGCELRMGKPQSAEATARKILAGAPYTEERIGLAAIATARSRLAEALRAQNRDKEAIPVLQQALTEYEKVQGPDSQGAISTLSNLANEYAWINDYAKALPMQREVYKRASARWGAQSQYALVELLNLGAETHDSGDLHAALPILQQAKAGLIKVSGTKSPVAQSARVVLATTLADLGRTKEALDMVDEVDPVAYQGTSTDPGRALVLQGFKADLELRLHKPGAEAKLRAAIAAMHKAGMAQEEIDTFAKDLPKTGAPQVAGTPAQTP